MNDDEKKKLLSAIKEKKLSIYSLGIEPTRRCNLECGHCYKDDAQPVDIGQEVSDKIFDEFRTVHNIDIFGGEMQNKPDCLDVVRKSIEKFEVDFGQFNAFTNGTFCEPEFFEILGHINKLSRVSDSVSLNVSHSYFHNQSYKENGISKEEVFSNISKMKKLARKHNIGFKKNEYNRKLNACYYYSGRAKNLAGQKGIYFYDPEYEGPDFLHLFMSDYFKKLRFFHEAEEDKYGIVLFSADAKGNVHHPAIEYVNGDKENLGNVLQTPISEIILKNSPQIDFNM